MVGPEDFAREGRSMVGRKDFEREKEEDTCVFLCNLLVEYARSTDNGEEDKGVGRVWMGKRKRWTASNVGVSLRYGLAHEPHEA